MPSLLDRALILPGNGRYLPRVVAFNPNRDEAGRFAESPDEGGGAAGGESPASSGGDKTDHHKEFDRLYEKAGKRTLDQSDLDQFRERLAKEKPAVVKELAKRIGITWNANTKAKAIERMESRLLSYMETAINTSFAQKPLPGAKS